MPCMCGTFEFCDDCIAAIMASQPVYEWKDYHRTLTFVIESPIDPEVQAALDYFNRRAEHFVAEIMAAIEETDGKSAGKL